MPNVTHNPDDSLDDLRQARASLAWLYEPGDQALREVVTSRGPLDAFDELAYGRDQHRPTGLRAELRHLPTERLWGAATVGVDGAQRDGARIVIPEDPDWPTGLADLAVGRPDGAADRPADGPAALCLWVRGDLPVAATLARSVTVTGSRAATNYGQYVATDLGRDLATHGWTVVASGGYGIDTAAHRGALAVEGATVAVLPAGLDRPYPTGNQTLFDTIASEGLLVSMWPPGTHPRRDRIAANRRLLAALSRGTILVEASLRSGALTTLREALALGRTAMVVPGPVTSAMSAGGHQALRDDPRIRLVTGLADVLTELDDVAAHPPA